MPIKTELLHYVALIPAIYRRVLVNPHRDFEELLSQLTLVGPDFQSTERSDLSKARKTQNSTDLSSHGQQNGNCNPATQLSFNLSEYIYIHTYTSQGPSPMGGPERRELLPLPNPPFSKLGHIQALCFQLKVTTVSPACAGQAKMYLHCEDAERFWSWKQLKEKTGC